MNRRVDIFAAGVGTLLALRQCTWVPVPLAVMALLLLVLVGVGLRGRTKSAYHPAVCWSLVAFVGVYGLSLLLNLQPATAIRIQRFAAFTIGMLALSPLISTERLARSRMMIFKSMMVTLMVMVCISSIIWVYAVLTHKHLSDHDFYMFGFRGVFETGMNLAPAAAIVGLFCLDQLIDKPSRWLEKPHLLIRLFFAWSCVASPLMLVSGGSRISVAGFVMASAMLLFLKRKLLKEWIRRMGKRKIAVVSVVVMVIAGGTLPLTTEVLRFKMSVVDHESIFYSREKIWHARMAEFESAPILGIGYAREFPKSEDQDSIIYGTSKADLSEIEPGSSYLSLLSYGGIVGAAAFGWFLVILLRAIVRDRRGARDQKSKQTDRPLFVALLVFMAVNAVAEGWLMFAGSLLFPFFWLATSMYFVHSTDGKVAVVPPGK